MTPFDSVIEQVKRRRFHNHRLEDHSDTVSEGFLADLTRFCSPLANELRSGTVKAWMNVHTPGARKRKIDLFVGEPAGNGQPDVDKIRIGMENKSVVTAHRNLYARFDDLNEALQVLHRARSEAVLAATVIVGTAERFLNVPDKLKPFYRKKGEEFERQVVPRLSSGDQALWNEFEWAVSTNRANDPRKTIEKFRQLPTRKPGHTHVVGYDYVLLVPVFIDNVSQPFIPPAHDPRSFGIDVAHDYAEMLDCVCKAYTARWHM